MLINSLADEGWHAGLRGGGANCFQGRFSGSSDGIFRGVGTLWCFSRGDTTNPIIGLESQRLATPRPLIKYSNNLADGGWLAGLCGVTQVV